jgi:hypothetical protein
MIDDMMNVHKKANTTERNFGKRHLLERDNSRGRNLEGKSVSLVFIDSHSLASCGESAME